MTVFIMVDFSKLDGALVCFRAAVCEKYTVGTGVCADFFGKARLRFYIIVIRGVDLIFHLLYQRRNNGGVGVT